MPKAYLKFNIPEEEYEFKIACAAIDMHIAIIEIENYMRSLRKYEERELIPKDEIMNKIREIINRVPQID